MASLIHYTNDPAKKNVDTQYTHDRKEMIVAVNGGSSSLKFGLFSAADTRQILAKGTMSGIGTANGLLRLHDPTGNGLSEKRVTAASAGDAAAHLVQWLKEYYGQYKIVAVGHRIVQGGPHASKPAKIDSQLLQELQSLESMAPLHLPDAISIVKVFKQSFPRTIQVACFDTSFHRAMPFEARHYALPRTLWKKGVIRYGFHGISCEYIVQRLREWEITTTEKKIIVAHLGSGSSLTAIRNGRSIDNTMGFTPTSGMIMNTRVGDIDPGIVSYLLKQGETDIDSLDDLFNKESGLKAIAGKAYSTKQLIEKAKSNTAAREAIRMYCYQAKKQIGSLTAALGGLDILVFTGGIGENEPVVRKYICDGLAFLGVQLSQSLNSRSATSIHDRAGNVQVYIIPTDEESMIAGHVKKYLRKLV